MLPVLNSIILYETGKNQAQLTLSYYLKEICTYQQAGCYDLGVDYSHKRPRTVLIGR